jgi:hypothetical protein
MPMKKNYTIIFVQNNVNKSENIVIDLAEIEKNEEILKKEIDKIVFVPRQNIVDKIIAFARETKK